MVIHYSGKNGVILILYLTEKCYSHFLPCWEFMKFSYTYRGTKMQKMYLRKQEEGTHPSYFK